jgi:hypothetical protein
VRTTEYWYLRWWSTVEQRYRDPYRETNRQTYLLVNTPDERLVEEDIRPAPRASTPHRQHKQGKTRPGARASGGPSRMSP